ncbi:MAG: DUF3526 domain-containing protein [Pseudomonadota bacterium]
MSWLQALKREANFLRHQKSFVAILWIALGLSTFAVCSGMVEIAKQETTIARLIAYDEQDRQSVASKYKDYGSLAYYSFHLTYLPPSSLAFSAIGQRDVMPWKHRIRMLALEGQIYETDADNPELSQAGRIDFAFLISVLSPLLVILLLHDLRASERNAGRYDLLVTTAKNSTQLWWSRTLILVSSLFVALVLPFCVGASFSGTSLGETLDVLWIVGLQIAFWTLLCFWVGRMSASAPKLASILLGVWLLTSVLVPVMGEYDINASVRSPNGGDIVLLQREAVNDAWDLPFKATFEPFLERHPEWKKYTEMESLFHWKWYYAFQQVGDQKAESVSRAYRQATLDKNTLAAKVAWLSPAMMTQQALTRLAKTDTLSALAYEQQIRDFHQGLRQFYYPLIFKDQEVTQEVLQQRPDFRALYTLDRYRQK